MTEEERKENYDEVSRKSRESQLRHDMVRDLVWKLTPQEKGEMEKKLKDVKDEGLIEFREALERSRRHSRTRLRGM